MKTKLLKNGLLITATLITASMSQAAKNNPLDQIAVSSDETYQRVINGLSQKEKGAADAYEQAITRGYLECRKLHPLCILDRVEDLTTVDNEVETVVEPKFGTTVEVPTQVSVYKYVAHYIGVDDKRMSARIANCDDPQQVEKATREAYENLYNTPANMDDDSSVMVSNNAVDVQQVSQASAFNQNWCVLQFTKAIDGVTGN